MENKQLRQCKQQMVESQKGQVARPHRPEDLLRELVPVIKDKWSVCLREGGTSLLGSGSSDPTRQEFAQGKFESGIEDFHSVLDQTLVNLKCATETSQQASASARYIPGNLSHHQNISTARLQINFTARIKDMLKSSVQGIVDHNPGLSAPQ
ncbi:mediator of RNA polymerase II transcription subunit 29-like isoform X2 [Eurytemora carolleeae]|uniref:mediator of RNA polymerase II transcription subunit 29-like isoform X2 n=1 Tax=Eurytemora carolleeae TaxID=1294199 RepID=UPI000C7674C8|nr:mediator of RNA polymerase II transcription subunit 29-like isoform X2 [Eurytemora carolleeae]|eukprot:XP_023325719.1 mediator of RNA polymerase II transcription subunit 29-like isoform X2 [Eurytemora affinis]